MKTVLILGDNRLSESIISGLSHKGIDVHQAVHSQSASESNHHVTIHKTGLSADALPSLFRDVKPDIVFSTQSAGSYDFQKQTIDAAISQGVQRFVPAEFSQDALNKRIQERLPPVKERARVIHYLEEQSSQGRLEWVAVASGCSLEHALASGNIGFDLKWQSATIHGTRKERFAASSTGWNGRLALAIIEHWDDIKNQYLYASGLVTTADEILDSIKNRTSQQWETGHPDVEELVHEAEKRFERGFPDAGMFLMERSVLYDETVDGVRPFQEHDAKGKLGLEGEALEYVVKKVVHDVKHHGHGDCGCG